MSAVEHRVGGDATAAAEERRTVPLCVDLDGTLIRSDMLMETALALLGRRSFWLSLSIVTQGRAEFKRRLAEAGESLEALRWPRDFGQGDKLFPLDRETGRYGQGNTEAVRG